MDWNKLPGLSIEVWISLEEGREIMGLSRLSEKCRKCPFVDKCNHKQMEGMLHLDETKIATNSVQLDQALLTTVYKTEKPVVDYKDEIRKQLYKLLKGGLTK